MKEHKTGSQHVQASSQLVTIICGPDIQRGAKLPTCTSQRCLNGNNLKLNAVSSSTTVHHWPLSFSYISHLFFCCDLGWLWRLHTGLYENHVSKNYWWIRYSRVVFYLGSSNFEMDWWKCCIYESLTLNCCYEQTVCNLANAKICLGDLALGMPIMYCVQVAHKKHNLGMNVDIVCSSFRLF